MKHTAFVLAIGVFLLSLIGPAIAIGVPTAFLGWSSDAIFSHLYIVGTLGQLLMDLVPVVLYAYACKGKWRGLTHNHAISVGVALVCAAVLTGIRIILAGRLMGGVFMGGIPAFTQSLTLPWPSNVLAAMLALLAYGPGEAIFVVYFVYAFDTAMGEQRPLLSWGVVITALIWGLTHIGNILWFGWGAISNAAVMVVVGLGMGLLFKGTRSSTGPMVFWTLVNGTSV